MINDQVQIYIVSSILIIMIIHNFDLFSSNLCRYDVCRFYCVSVKQHKSDDKKYSLKKLVSVAKCNNIDLKVYKCKSIRFELQMHAFTSFEVPCYILIDI